MENTERRANYGPRETSARARRLLHKEYSRKTHAHVAGERCLRCKGKAQVVEAKVPRRIPFHLRGPIARMPEDK